MGWGGCRSVEAENHECVCVRMRVCVCVCVCAENRELLASAYGSIKALLRLY
jgi:hypothetical protein